MSWYCREANEHAARSAAARSPPAEPRTHRTASARRGPGSGGAHYTRSLSASRRRDERLVAALAHAVVRALAACEIACNAADRTFSGHPRGSEAGVQVDGVGIWSSWRPRGRARRGHHIRLSPDDFGRPESRPKIAGPVHRRESRSEEHRRGGSRRSGRVHPQTVALPAGGLSAGTIPPDHELAEHDFVGLDRVEALPPGPPLAPPLRDAAQEDRLVE